MENKNGSMVFLGVIGVATLVVAIIGATFAFFSASANSATDAITAGATNISLNFTDSVYTNAKTHLIPATETIATYAAIQQEGKDNYFKNDGTHTVNSQCIDDNGNDVCSIYEFTVTNPSATTSQDITATLKVATNTFWDTSLATPTGNLKYKVYAGSTDSSTNINGRTNATTKIAASATPLIAESTFGAANSEVTLDLGGTGVSKVTLAPSATNTYTIVIYLKESGEQNKDQGKAFAAGLTITSGSGQGVTGVISAAG